MNQFKIPILLINYNRPDLSERVLEKVLQVNPGKLYISIDGPNLNKPNDEKKVMLTRNLFNNLTIKGQQFKLFHKKNLGCKEAIQTAINWFFKNEEMGIILEDDILPKESFFPFMEEVLNKYKNEDKVSLVSGCNFFPINYHISESYYFSKYSHIWGWGTWKRSWELYDAKGMNWRTKWKQIKKKNNFSYLESKYWFNSFKSVYENSYDTWDHQLSYSNLINSKLNIMPSIPLIHNLGFREDATHTSLGASPLSKNSNELIFPLHHPKEISIDFKNDQFSRKQFKLYPWFLESFIIILVYLIKFKKIISKKVF